jgi:hypothetical protein
MLRCASPIASRRDGFEDPNTIPNKQLQMVAYPARQRSILKSAVERAGLSTLNENQVIEYDLVENRGKASAENLKVS